MRQARVVLGAFLCHDEHWCVSFRLHPEVRPRALRPMPISCLSLGVTVTGMSRQSPFLDSLLQIVYIQMIGSHPNYLLVNVYIVWGRRNILFLRSYIIFPLLLLRVILNPEFFYIHNHISVTLLIPRTTEAHSVCRKLALQL